MAFEVHREVRMKPFLLVMFAISSTAMATAVYDWQTEQLSLTTQVNSGLTYRTSSDSFSGTFSINFSGLGSIYTPAFFLTIPVDISLSNDAFTFNFASACVEGACYSTDSTATTNLQYIYLIQYVETSSRLEPLLVPISLATSAVAEYHESEILPFPTTASATVTVDFGDLVLKDALGNNITSLVSFTVTPPGSLSPEPSSFVLAGAGILALAIRRIRRPFAQN